MLAFQSMHVHKACSCGARLNFWVNRLGHCRIDLRGENSDPLGISGPRLLLGSLAVLAPILPTEYLSDVVLTSNREERKGRNGALSAWAKQQHRRSLADTNHG